MISPLDDARDLVQVLEQTEGRASESRHVRETFRALIQHGEEMERQLALMKARLDRIEEPDRPPSGLMMGGDG